MDLNICLLNDSFPPQIDGVANSVINYAKVISAGDGRCTVVAPKYPDVFDEYDFPVLRYPSLNTQKFAGYRTGYPFGSKTLDYLEKQKFDILHSHCPFASGLLARTLRERVDAPYVFTYHTKFDIEIAKLFSSDRLQNTATRMMVNNIEAADEVWVVSRGAGENLRSIGFKGDFIVMKNGVDIPRERSDDESVRALRNELNLTRDVPLFLFVGRLRWYKGIKISLDALSRIKKDGLDFTFIIVGDGADRAEMEQYAAEIGISENCKFVGAIRDRDKLRTYYTMSDMFLFPSTYDTNGLVVTEAAAAALPSMLIRGSCAAEDVSDGHNGILIDENPDSMARALHYVCNNLSQVHQIGLAAQNEIYISWADAVDVACKRYEYLHEKSLAGKLPRKDIRGNGMFELIADWDAAVSKIVGLPRTVIEKTGKVFRK